MEIINIDINQLNPSMIPPVVSVLLLIKDRLPIFILVTFIIYFLVLRIL